MWKTVSQWYFVLFVHPQLNTALQSSFYVSLSLRNFCAGGRLLIKVPLDRLIIRNPFFQISQLKKAVLYVVQYIFQKIIFYFKVCFLIDFVDMKHTLYNFLKENETKSFIFFKEISFYKGEFVELISIIKSEIPTLPPNLPNSYINQVSRTTQINLQPLLSLLASFLKIFWHPFWVYYCQFTQVKNSHLLFLFG